MGNLVNSQRSLQPSKQLRQLLTKLVLTAESTSGTGANQVAPCGEGLTVGCAMGWQALVLGNTLRGLLFGELAETRGKSWGCQLG